MSTKKDRSIIGTYLLHNKQTGQAYVGSGVLIEREYDHFYKLTKGTHKNKKLQDAFNNNPNFDFVGVPLENREIAFDAEQSIIDDFIESPLLLNIVKDARYGNGSGWKHTEESKLKNRLAHLGKKTSDETKAKLRITSTGNTNSLGLKQTPEQIAKTIAALTGRKVSQETRDKIRLSNLNKIVSEETKEKLRLANIGNTHTEESKQKMSDSRKGIPKTQEHKDKIGLWHKDKLVSQETRDKISVSNKGRVVSDETKAKISTKVCINGIEYKSMTEASKVLNINLCTVSHRVKNKNMDNWVEI